jgi:DNA-binding protein HU-beta
MTKIELVAEISARSQKSRQEAGRFLAAAVDAMKAALRNGNKVALTNFGVIDVKERKGRVTLHPRTGERVEIPAGRMVGFRMSKRLKGALRG